MTLDDMRREVADLQNEAGKPCRCDGGCAPCAACIAAKKLSNYGKEDRNRRQSGPRISDIARAVDNVTSGRFSSAHPNEANTPKEQRAAYSTPHPFYIDESPNGERYFINGVITARDTFERRRAAECIHRLRHGSCTDCGYTPKPVKWVLHGDYAHVAGQPCAQCNPSSTLTLYRSCLANCYCPDPSPSGYKPLCMNCQQAHNLAPKIVAEMLGAAK